MKFHKDLKPIKAEDRKSESLKLSITPDANKSKVDIYCIKLMRIL